jgi:DnaK suppressor protein
MGQINLEKFRRKLEIEREETMHSLDRLGSETRAIDSECAHDNADLCMVNMSRESLFEQCSQCRKTVRLIDAALERIREGTFGQCSGCGNDIQLRRLEAVPWTEFCLRCQEELEDEVGASSSARGFVAEGMARRRAG